MNPRGPLHIHLAFGESLVGSPSLDVFQQTMLDSAPSWSERLRISNGSGAPRDRLASTWLRTTVERAGLAGGRGGRRRSSNLSEPTVGDLLSGRELRGADDSLEVWLFAQDCLFMKLREAWAFANAIEVDVHREMVEKERADDWATSLLLHMCRAGSIWYARIATWGEFLHKNLTQGERGSEPVGLDVSRALPGLYWANYFGAPYVKLIGRERLLSAPAWSVKEVGQGILLELDAESRRWETAAYKVRERQVLEHLGNEYFFCKEAPARDTVGPDLGLQ